MKKAITFIIITGISFNLSGQKKPFREPVVSMRALNILYYGIDNPIQVAVPGVDGDSLLVTAQHGDIRKTRNNKSQYVIHPHDSQLTSVMVKYISNRDTITSGEFKFVMKRIPDPIPSILKMSGRDTLTRLNRLVAARGILAKRNEDFMFDVKYKVIAYDLRIEMKRKFLGFHLKPELTKFRGTSAYIGKEMNDKFKELQDGDKVEFSNIKVLFPDGEERIIKDIIELSLQLEQ